MEKGVVKILFGIIIMLMFSILIAADEAWFLLIGVGFGFWLYYSGLRNLMTKERQFNANQIQAMHQLAAQDKYELHFEYQAWHNFAQQETQYTKRAPWLISGVIVCMMGFGSGLAILNSGSSPAMLLVMLPVIGPVAYAIWLFMNDTSTLKLESFLVDRQPRVIVSQTGILINQKLVYRLDYPKQLINFELVNAEGIKYLHINYALNSGKQINQQYYRFPMPKNVKVEELNQYFGL